MFPLKNKIMFKKLAHCSASLAWMQQVSFLPQYLVGAKRGRSITFRGDLRGYFEGDFFM
jgi:hypothetical protein